MAIVHIDEYDVLVDDEDALKVSSLKWYVDRKAGSRGQHYFRRCYVVETGKQSTISLHRFIMGCVRGDGKYVDHINHNTLDCRKSNLRVCSRTENTRNLTRKNSPYGYKGVAKYYKTSKNFYGVINRRINGKMVVWKLGLYKTAEEAAIAYDKACLYMFKEFACPNFPRENYSEKEINTFFPSMYPDYETTP